MKTKMRKKFQFLILPLTAFIIISLTMCRGEFCDSYEDDLISTGVSVSAIITYSDLTPYQGPVIFSIKMITCEEDVTGYHNLDQIPSNAQGEWESGETYTYSMDRTKDEIIIRFHFENTATAEVYDPEFILTYYDIKDAGNILAMEYIITLPWGP